jgi:mono/diheme cytochrome c family protein
MSLILRMALSAALIAAVGIPVWAADEPAPPSTPIFSHGENFDEQSGASLYSEVCQDCHMADGKGASGAGRYPMLAGNPKLEAAGYPITIILNGMNGMPPIGKMMSDAQVALVVNYVRTHFGNAYTDPVKPEDVKPLR